MKLVSSARQSALKKDQNEILLQSVRAKEVDEVVDMLMPDGSNYTG